MLLVQFNRELVLRCNELFHDLEGEGYEDVHPEIFERETLRWQRTLENFLPKIQGDVSALDIGAGTGFVGKLLLPMLSNGATFTAADVSTTMLKVCQVNLAALRTPVHVQVQKITDESLPFPDESFNLITMNSVLHHVPNPTALLQEIIRVLAPGGIVMIGHEPNALFFRSRFLFLHARFIHHCTWKRLAALLLKALGLYQCIVPAEQKSSHILPRINQTLIAEGLIKNPLTAQELSALVDIHSPTAGGLRAEEGFDATTLFNAWIPPMRILRRTTYNHLLKMSGRWRVMAPYERFLEQFLPNHGSSFFLVAEKAHHSC
jgi:ubiquinone/menaquinone biosynthesis C-methylase UbiE